MAIDIALPTSISHLAACEVLLVVAALLAAFLPLGERLDSPPPAHNHMDRLCIDFVKYGPQSGSLIALGAIFLCFMYAWVHKLGILQASLVLLFLGVVVFIGVVLASLILALKSPPEKQYEEVNEQDITNLTNPQQGI